jgi:glycosyltransferase involved in cell wall biosynthesis
LHLIPYSPNGPIHGGKIRANEISKVLARVDPNLEVIHLGDSDYKERSPLLDLSAIPKSLVGDLEMLQKDFDLSSIEFPDLKIIVFEHPWLWNEVKSLKRKYPNVKIVYSSHNVEYQLKDEILFKFFGQRAGLIPDAIKSIEIDISRNVDRVLVVSQQDRDWYSQFTKLEPILAKNGTRQRSTILKSNSGKLGSKALVVGSAHPPNIEGCLKFLSDPDLWMPKNAKIIVVGSLASALSAHWGHLRNRWGEVCVELIPEVDDLGLTQLLQECSVILLPIAYGGGTNLKSAEALVSGRPIVASSQSFRGYEEYTHSPLVNIAKTNLEFKVKVTAILIGERIASVERNISKLYWNSTLGSIEPTIQELING